MRAIAECDLPAANGVHLIHGARAARGTHGAGGGRRRGPDEQLD
jgi:hypothetical protein